MSCPSPKRDRVLRRCFVRESQASDRGTRSGIGRVPEWVGATLPDPRPRWHVRQRGAALSGRLAHRGSGYSPTLTLAESLMRLPDWLDPPRVAGSCTRSERGTFATASF